jgi:hypothetical protein
MKPATPLPWEWWTSNSHHRLSSKATGKDGDVLHAHVARDGMPCINVKQGDDEYIVHACNAYPRLVMERAQLIDALHYWLSANICIEEIPRTDPAGKKHWRKFYEHAALLRELGEDK